MESEDDCESNGELCNIEDMSYVDTKDALSEVFNKEIRPLIDLIDKLRRYGIQQDIALPNVVVVGDQSSGKSSIIEALSGVQLPRGKGIVTRCPLELQLKRVAGKTWKAKLSYKNRNGSFEEYEIYRPEEVEVSVRRAQEAICGTGKGVSNELITLRVESPEETAPDLTLIDLPGIARIAVNGQPDNICETIRDMIMKHVSSQRTVILCVISANLDVAVNESIRIAMTVDPQGERTIGVVTKPDAAEESMKEDVLCLLNNEKIKLVKGYTMVKCRSQPELERNVSLKESIQNEKEFFEIDRIYKQANRAQLGTMNLARKISEELVNVIKKSLPDLKAQIEEHLQQAHEALDLLKEAVPTDNIEKQTYLTKLIWNLNAGLKDCLIEGRNANKTENYYYTWRKLFDDFLKIIEDKTKGALKTRFSSSNLLEIISKNRGRELNGFLDFDVFKKLIPSHISSYEIEAVDLLKKMRSYVESYLSSIISVKCNHLPEIEKDLKEILNIEAKNAQQLAAEKIKFIFKQESIIFTMDVVFNKELNEFKTKKFAAIAEAQKKNNSAINSFTEYGTSDDHDLNPEEMHDMLRVYLNIVNRRLSDVIPMTIMQCLLMELTSSIENEFIKLCNNKSTLEKVKENKVYYEKRKIIKDKIKRLQKANSEITRF